VSLCLCVSCVSVSLVSLVSLCLCLSVCLCLSLSLSTKNTQQINPPTSAKEPYERLPQLYLTFVCLFVMKDRFLAAGGPGHRHARSCLAIGLARDRRTARPPQRFQKQSLRIRWRRGPFGNHLHFY